jgi:hypothetical protein
LERLMEAELINILKDVAVTVAVGAVSAATLVITTSLKKKFGIEIEARHREAFHRAAETVVKDLIHRRGPGSIPDTEIGNLIRKMEQSVPDAFQALQPSKDVVVRVLRSKFPASR